MFRFIAPGLVLLAACSTPQDRCISSGSRDLRVITSLIAETRGNIARGFAIAEQEDIITVRGTCKGRNEDGSEFTFSCPRTETITERVPVAIDLNAEKAKLASLEERQLQLQENQAALIAQCRAQFPEA